MKVGEARGIYSAQLTEYNTQKFKLAQQINKLKEQGQEDSDLGVVLELQYQAVSDKQDEYQEYMDELMSKWSSKFNEVAEKQNADAAEDYYQDLAKIMEVARRMAHGDTVPGTDEKKLMEYDSDLYQMVKNAQMLAQNEKKKKYDSLWEDEEKKEYDDPDEVANDQEVTTSAPEVVEVSEVMESAAASQGSE